MNLRPFPRWKHGLLTLASVLAFNLGAGAQIESGTFVGTVTDPSGDLVPRASITVTNQGTNVTIKRETNASGVYRVGNLPPAVYTIKVQAPGFETVVNRDVELTVGVVQRVDFALKLGATVQTLTVESVAPLVNTEEGRLSALVASAQVANLPLNGRNIFQLMQLAPGAVNVTGVMYENNSNTIVNGVRENFNGFWMDGVANKGLSGGYVTLPNPDTVQEFRINTLNMSAEFGNSAGSITTIVTKSGTNQFHGTAYDYLRNDALDATEFFRNQAHCILGQDPFCHGPDQGNGRGSLGKALLRFNQFGATLGGPVIRDKTFFFASFQGDRTETYFPAFPITLESPEWRRAVIAARPDSVAALLYKDFPGPEGTVLNTVDEFVANNWGGFDSFLCPDFLGPNNATDFQNASRIASNFQTLFGVTASEAASCPTPIAASQTATQIANRSLPFQVATIALLPVQTGAGGLLTHGNSWSARIDQNFGTGDRVFGRVYLQDQTEKSGEPGFPTATSLRGFNNPFSGVFPSLALSWTHILSPTVVNELRAGYARSGTSLSVEKLAGVPGVGFDTRDLGIGSYAGYPFVFVENIFSFSDLVSIAKGKHGFKTGFDLRRNYENSDFNFARPSYYFFDNLFFAADAPYEEFSGVDPGITSKRPSQLANNVRAFRNWEVGVFIQDDWKVNSHLTLNLGLRYDLYTRHTEKYGKGTKFILPPGANSTERVRSTGTPVGLPGCDTPEQIALAQLAGICGPGGFAPAKVLGPGDHNNFGPRFGFAWSPDASGKTSVRGGFGVSYEGTLYNPLSNTRWNLPYYSVNFAANFLGFDVNNIAYGPSKVDANGNVIFDPTQTPTYEGPATNPGQGNGAQAVGNLIAWDPSNPNLNSLATFPDPNGMRDPYIYSYFFGVQHELSRNLVLEVNYVGSSGHKLMRAQSINRTRGGALPIPGSCLDSQGETVCSNRDETINPVTGNFVNPTGSVNPTFDFLRAWENAINSNYNSLQASLMRKPIHGLAFSVNYTWGHSIDSASTWHQSGTSNNGRAAGDGFSLDLAHPGLDRGNSTFDFRHRLVFNEVWELPWMQTQKGFLGHLLGGWQLNSIWVYQTGSHWSAYDGRPARLSCAGGSADGLRAATSSGANACIAGGGEIINMGGDYNLDGLRNDRPDATGSNTIHATKDQWANGFFDGLSAIDAGFLRTPCLACNGTLGRNTMVGPGMFNTDFSAFKKIPVKERLWLQFRAEFFNAFNRTNFRPPNARVNGANGDFSPIFGQAAGTFDPREIQLALKLIW